MLEPNEGKLSRSVLRRGGESNLASLSRPVCSSVKPCEIGENLLSVSNPISRLQEKLIHVGALIVHQLFNVDQCQAYIHTLRWKDRPLQCPRCQSRDVDPWGQYHYRPGCNR